MVLLDAAAIAVAAYAAWVTRIVATERWWPERWESWFKEPLVIYIVPAALVGLWVSGLYRPRRDKSLLAETALVLRASLAAVGAIVLVAWAIDSDMLARTGGNPVVGVLGVSLDGARIQMGLLALLTPSLLALERNAVRLVLRAMRRRGLNQRHVAVVGVGRLGQIVARTLARNTWTGISVAYFISHHETPRRASLLGKPVRGGRSEIERTLEDHPVDAVYLALPAAQAGLIPELLRRLDRYVIDVRLVPDASPRYMPQAMAVGELEGMPILSCRESPLYGVGGVLKRAVDLGGALFGLVVLSPVFAAIAVAVRLSGPGKVIFKQKRMGLNGEIFNIYKFRTMRADAREEDGPAWTSRGDPRITRVGAVLRATSLDELPQLVNVLGGRMSLVGPRPERPELIERFRDDWRGYMLRQHVKSGMTGFAQINGLRGDTSLKKRLQYDLFYVRHWSVWFDLRILFLTFFRGFVHRNAH